MLPTIQWKLLQILQRRFVEIFRNVAFILRKAAMGMQLRSGGDVEPHADRRVSRSLTFLEFLRVSKKKPPKKHNNVV